MTPKQLKKANQINASKGGFARAKKLSSKRRSEIARMGALVANAKRTIAPTEQIKN